MELLKILLIKLFEHKRFVFLLMAVIILSLIYNKDIYYVTAYCNCKICVNKKGYRDKRFASGKKTYFGGAAADSKFPFRTAITLLPLNAKDEKAIKRYLDGRNKYLIEDRGHLIKGKTIDIFIPKRLGGHRTAQKWGKRRMKIKFEFLNKSK